MTELEAAEFQLHSQLAADTLPVAHLSLCDVLLINDARYPWCLLVPRVPGLVELHDLSDAQTAALYAEIRLLSVALKDLTGASKMNVAALGNMVEQLHVHVIARNTADAAWPGPVWGVGQATPYSTDEVEALVSTLRQRLG